MELACWPRSCAVNAIKFKYKRSVRVRAIRYEQQQQGHSSCAGYKSGCESSVHAMRQMFESSETEAVIIVDATNAFNLLNREAALRNIHHFPRFSPTLTGRMFSYYFIDGETGRHHSG